MLWVISTLVCVTSWRWTVPETPLLGDRQWVVENHFDSIELVGQTAGPAGSDVLAFRGVEVDIDVASPRTANRVLVTGFPVLRDPASRKLLTRLLGGEVLQEIDELVGRGSKKLRIQPSGRHSDDGVAPPLAALAAVLHSAREFGRTPEEEAVALQEAFVLASRLALLDDLDGLAEQARAAATWLGDADEELFADADPSAIVHVADVLREAADLHESRIGSSLRRVAALLSIAPGAAAGAPDLDGRVPMRVTFSRDSLPMLVTGWSPTMHRTSGDEYEVRLPGWSRRIDGWWVRAFVGGSTTPIAVVPMLPDDEDAVATMLLPDLSPEVFLFDVVEDVTSRRSDGAVAAFRAALSAGRRAARQERLGRLGRARELWRQSAALHREVGDEMRAGLALAIAEDQLGGSRAIERRAFDALASDRLGPDDG